MIVLQAAQTKGPVGGRPLGFPLFTMQGGPGGHLRFPPGINRVDRCRFPVPRVARRRPRDRATSWSETFFVVLELLVQKLTFLEILNRCILNIFYVLVEKKIKKKCLGRLLAVVVQKCTSRL